MSAASIYHDRTGEDPAQGSAIQVSTYGGEVTLELGVMRNFGSMSADAWAALSPAEARELADNLRRAASWAEACAPSEDSV
ncbi:hypothetical protein M446_4072 [Methylobacterium sp. 4-46]|uniref:hypothetical protein n=1 Tax=unclassified Methylobacterium TaxID=2615210 RepID=UPI000152DB48|nr:MULTISPECIES: hypothetical protein [Methylobacterium]ACA18430.1 hypothetical protein M446_4072 [Methylobacterium sp. 4-46]WFT77723.1 hypothetical protein QA634_20695 [Methylobacterium nodulans]